MLATLEASYIIWKESSETSMEAFKASGVLGIILEKLKLVSAAKPQTTAEVFAQFDEQRPEHSAAMTLGMLSGGLTPNSAAMFNAMAQSPGGTRYTGMDMGMNDPVGGTGLTPNFPMDTSGNPFVGVNGAPSPFSMFGNTGGGMGIGEVPANLDWVCYLLALCLSSLEEKC